MLLPVKRHRHNSLIPSSTRHKKANLEDQGNFLELVKITFHEEPAYKLWVKLLLQYHDKTVRIQEVEEASNALFKHQPLLLAQLRSYLPQVSAKSPSDGCDDTGADSDNACIACSAAGGMCDHVDAELLQKIKGRFECDQVP